jgi:hypothetical protein
MSQVEEPVHPDAGEAPALCSRCQGSDETLLFSIHPYVISTIVEADQRAEAGMFCDSCRSRVATLAVARSVFGGWWSAKGPAATIRAIRVNLAGGEFDRTEGAELHRELSAAKERAGDLNAAIRHGIAAQSMRSDVEFGRHIYALRKTASYQGEVTFNRRPARLVFIPIAAAAILVLVCGGWLVARIVSKEPAPGSIGAAMAAGVGETSDTIRQLQQKQADDDAKRKAQIADSFRQRTPDEQADEIAKRISERTTPFPAGAIDTQAEMYVALRLDAVSRIGARIDKGEAIYDLEQRVNALRSDPVAAPVLKRDGVSASYDRLVAVMAAATRDYRQGAPTIDLQKLAHDLSRAGDSSVISAVRENRRLGRSASQETIQSWVGSDLIALDLIMRKLVTEEVMEALSDFKVRLRT